MPRPYKRRRICGRPACGRFGPLDASEGERRTVSMTLDELESLRLIDLEGLTQEECAGRMNVARTTIQAIYAAARKKLAECLVWRRELNIEGGDYVLCDGSAEQCRRPEGCIKAALYQNKLEMSDTMTENCNHDCSSCSASCNERKETFYRPQNGASNVKKVIAVVSGKGGVGKTLVTSLLAVLTNRTGANTAIMDADITGPSIPKTFGLEQKAEGGDNMIYPVGTRTGISVMSLNLLLEHETDPVIWRGPAIAGAVTQFWTDVAWGDIDYMYVDMPPGTGDVPLTVFQSMPVDGIVIVTSPQELVSMIVEKAVNMADAMHIPVLGLVENMSSFKCPDCGKVHHIFGESHVDEIAARHGIKTVCRIPIDPDMATDVDDGLIELMDNHDLDELVKVIVGDKAVPAKDANDAKE